MDYVESDAVATSTPKSKKNVAASTKCSWCDRKRARNDLCNVCRQKVESRARRLMEQKIEGDMEVVQKVMMYLKDNIALDSMNNTDLMSLISESFPFLMLKFQSENTYRGKKGNRCWCLPESVLKKLIISCYKDKTKAAEIQKGGRAQLCQVLMNTVSQSFSKYNSDSNSNNSNKRKAADIKYDIKAPPHKKHRRTDINDFIDHQIWGRSDTELLSFDINKLNAFLVKFDAQVLNGRELEGVEASQRVDFLKKRCKEFVKIMNELRDYVIHLRVNNATDNQEKEALLRCTNNLLSKVSANTINMESLRMNMNKLEEYHNFGCNELYDAVQSFEWIGTQIGYRRAPNTSLKEYANHIELNMMRNNRSNNNNINSINSIYHPQQQQTVTPPIRINNMNNTQQMMHQSRSQPQHMILTPITYNNNGNINRQTTIPLNRATLNSLDRRSVDFALDTESDTTDPRACNCNQCNVFQYNNGNNQ